MRGSRPGPPFRLTGILLCAVLAGCGATSSNTAAPFPSFTPRPTVIAASPPGSDGVQHVTIAAKESLFRPPNITAHPGTIKITVVNEDNIFHNITVDVAGGANSGTIDGGATKSVQFSLHNLGKYGFFCSYHEDTGMIGVLDIR
ncbi:MAG TPA: cupredoxin domain-containing protein [Mycobacteriales bacterium]|nr:cupredoxin domain-containing protein [Mycobacteriales bacterium]